MIAFVNVRGMRYSVRVIRVDRDKKVVECMCNATRLVIPTSLFWSAGYNSL